MIRHRLEAMPNTNGLSKKIHPREWFYVLPEHVGQAAKLIDERRLHEFRYDPNEQKIIAK